MARPRNTGLDYFPFDCDFFSDEKVVVVAGEFQIKGEIVIVKLLCEIYRNGYFVEWNEMMKYKMVAQLHGMVNANCLDSIINRLVRWRFFDKDLFDSAGILTSLDIQQRYFEASKFRKLDDDLPYLLVKPRVNYAEKGVSQTLTPVSHGKMQEIKLKENKLKKYPPTSDTKKPAAVAASDADAEVDFGKDLSADEVKLVKVTLAKAIASSASLAKEFGVDAETVMTMANDVADRWLLTGEFDRKRPFTHMLNTIGKKLTSPQLTPASVRRTDPAVEREQERQRRKEEERRHAAGVVKPDEYLRSRGIKPGTSMAKLAREEALAESQQLSEDVRSALDVIKSM